MATITVRVKPGQRGYYGIPAADAISITGVEPGTEIIRNEGEVFDMDVRACKAPGSPGTADAETVTVGRESYALPSWVESASHAPITAADKVPKGHKAVHRDEPSGSVI